MSDHNERSCQKFGSLTHHENECEQPSIEPLREWWHSGSGWLPHSQIKDAIAAHDNLKNRNKELEQDLEISQAALRETDYESHKVKLRETESQVAALTKERDEALAAVGQAVKSNCDAALLDRIQALEVAAQNFVNKVESGRAQSKESYADFKAALATPILTTPTKGVL